MAKEIFGIDLGTTNSCIAEISAIDKLPIVIKNSEDLATTPSVVFYDEFGSPIVGGEAKRSMLLNPTRAVAFIKREMSNPSYKRTIGEEKISPVKVSAMILKKLVDDANLSRQYRGKSAIKDVVITVPAYFGNNERELTKQAGEVAGLNVLALLNEPTAAALSYGSKRLEGKTFMVYDLGGGTFDVSIMKMNNGELETLSTDGDQRLGGVDWDAALVNNVLKDCCRVTEKYEDIKDTRDGGALILAAEQCKKLLSKNQESPMRFRYKGRMYTKPVKRTDFEKLTEHLLQRTIDVVKHARAIATQDVKHIDEIILVGGSSYMPMVKNRLEKEFPGVTIRLDQFEPDLAVAKGAAIHAFNMVNPTKNQTTCVRLGKDLASRSYGVEVVMSESGEDRIMNLVSRTDPMVFSGTDVTCTRFEDQTGVSIIIYENTSTDKYVALDKGKLISRKEITWGYGVPKGTDIDYRIRREANGIVHIEVECQGKKIYFDIEPDHGLSESEKNRLQREIGKMQL